MESSEEHETFEGYGEAEEDQEDDAVIVRGKIDEEDEEEVEWEGLGLGNSAGAPGDGSLRASCAWRMVHYTKRLRENDPSLKSLE